MFNWFKKTKTCPNCHLDSGWDGHKCVHCGYIESLAKKKTELLTQVMDLFDPKIYNLQDIYYTKQLIPERLGVYAWYFDNLFDTYFAHNNQSVIRIDPKWFLLYIGIAEYRTLRDRIHGDHLNQNSEGSTLRQSLAALLWKDIDLDASKQLNGENEKMKLNNWIFHHAVVAWTETDKPEVVENLMLHEFGHLLYLNIENNKKNPNRKILKQLRKLWRKGK
ncbi:MAG: GIY-YIG nuclease family protein [Sedimentisphaerales bacterium]